LERYVQECSGFALFQQYGQKKKNVISAVLSPLTRFPHPDRRFMLSFVGVGGALSAAMHVRNHA
jgi:hypothetical protein